MPITVSRREFLAGAALAATRTMALPMLVDAPEDPPFKISLAQWSFHKALKAGELDHLDFARVARTEFDIGAVEYVNTFFKDKATDSAYLAEMNRRARDQGVFQHLIMIDVEGRLGDPDPALRSQAVENHKKWVDAARTLGCITIRVNAESEGPPAEQQKLVADGLRRLAEYGDSRNINVIVENHGDLSSHGDWLAGVMKLVNHPRCGTLPDFGNFTDYDRYKGVEEMMPYAKAVSAKTYDFDVLGDETTIDYRRMMRIVTAAGFHSWMGIEYEGERLSERDGVTRTKALLERIAVEMQAGAHRPG
ncbi:MAG TPA: sugar phosphate isomerase/epimerase family protein [Gemmatimonadales bacterium]|nr:sugar phosphate isomerase/epimerase family protein [Gemmatimonadales bacterium]